jgi:hypothetical protein
MWPPPSDDDFRLGREARPAASSDVRLTCQVIERILEDPRLSGERITVEVQNRVVTLIGTASSLYARVAAAELARSTPGVTDICNRVELARSADITDGFEGLRPDPFDELVAHWDDTREQPRLDRRTRKALLHAAAVVVAFGAAGLWVVLMPRLGNASLFVVLPCVAAAVALALRADQERRSNSNGSLPPGRHSR